MGRSRVRGNTRSLFARASPGAPGLPLEILRVVGETPDSAAGPGPVRSVIQSAQGLFTAAQRRKSSRAASARGRADRARPPHRGLALGGSGHHRVRARGGASPPRGARVSRRRAQCAGKGESATIGERGARQRRQITSPRSRRPLTAEQQGTVLSLEEVDAAKRVIGGELRHEWHGR